MVRLAHSSAIETIISYYYEEYVMAFNVHNSMCSLYQDNKLELLIADLLKLWLTEKRYC
jgi:hypothetical protein